MNVELKRKLIATLIAPAIGMSVAAVAADRSDARSSAASEQQASAQESSAAHADRDVRASKLIGMKVKNAQGETLGKIDDLVVDVTNERVHYGVLASGGLMGMGGKLFAYPVSLFRPGTDKDELVLNVEKDRLKNAPGFEKKNWPEWSSSGGYRADVDRYFGPTVAVKPMPNERLVRASTLIGKDIEDRDGKNAGEIKDLVVNLGTSRVRYAVMDFDKSWTTSDKLLPMSLHSFTFPTNQKKDLVLNLSKNQLDTAQGIDKGRWKDMDINDPTYKRNVDSSMHTATASAPSAPGAAGRSADRDRTNESSGSRNY